MDLVSAFSSMQQSNVIGQVQIAVAKRIMETEQQAGTGAIQLLDSAMDGSNASASAVVSAANGLGNQLDVTG